MNYIQQRKQRDREMFDKGMRTGVQLVADFMAMALTEPETMGKYRVMSRESLDRVFARCSALDDHYSMAFSDHVEADYIREEMDRKLREIYKEDADPFEVRYPFAKNIQYLKPKKGWI